MTHNPNVVQAAPVAAAASAGGSAPPTTLRLQLDPDGPAEPDLDGAWWPRSTELPTELPALLAALSAHLGPTALIGYRRDAWNAAPDHLDLAGHAVHLQGFISLRVSPGVSPAPSTLVVVDDRGRRVTVRVVPPGTDSATAAALMAAATHHPVEHGGGGSATQADAAAATSLDEVAGRLSRLPGNTDPARAAVISGWVAEAADQFRDVPIKAFVPILVEHIVRERLYDNRVDHPPTGVAS